MANAGRTASRQRAEPGEEGARQRRRRRARGLLQAARVPGRSLAVAHAEVVQLAAATARQGDGVATARRALAAPCDGGLRVGGCAGGAHAAPTILLPARAGESCERSVCERDVQIQRARMAFIRGDRKQAGFTLPMIARERTRIVMEESCTRCPRTTTTFRARPHCGQAGTTSTCPEGQVTRHLLAGWHASSPLYTRTHGTGKSP